MRDNFPGGDLLGIEFEVVGCGEGDGCSGDGWGGVQREVTVFVGKRERLVWESVGRRRFCCALMCGKGL